VSVEIRPTLRSERVSRKAGRVGIDVVQLAKVERACDRWGRAYTHRFLGPSELNWANEDPARVAALLAVKEAAIKSWGSRGRGFAWPAVEVQPDDEQVTTRLRSPLLAELGAFTGSVVSTGRVRDLGPLERCRLDVAWSSDGGVAIAVAVASVWDESA
jgi:phosphopantetheine--protein transferase-like protein